MKDIKLLSISDAVNGLFDLFPNMYVMIATLIGAAVLYMLIKKLVWHPVMKLMSQRAEMMEQELADAKHAKAEALELEKEAKDKLSIAAQKAANLVGEAKTEANQVRYDAANKAKDEAKRIVDSANQEIKLAKKRLAGEVRKEIVDVAFDAAEKIIEKKIDKKEGDILDDFVSRLDESK